MIVLDNLKEGVLTPKNGRRQSRRYGTATSVQTGRGRSLLPRCYPKERKLVDQTGVSWNRISDWLKRLEAFSQSA